VANPSWAKSAVPLSCVILVDFFGSRSADGGVGQFFGRSWWCGSRSWGLGLYHLLQNPEILAGDFSAYAGCFFASMGGRVSHSGFGRLAVTGGEAL